MAELFVETRCDSIALYQSELYWKTNCGDDFSPERSRLAVLSTSGGTERYVYYPGTCLNTRVASDNLAFDQTYVYWITGGGKIVRLSRSASVGTPEELSQTEATYVAGYPTSFCLAIIGEQILWSEKSKLFSVPRSGGARVVRGTTLNNQPVSNLVATSQNVFLCLAGGILQKVNASTFSVERIADGVSLFTVVDNSIFIVSLVGHLTAIRQIELNTLRAISDVYMVTQPSYSIDAISGNGTLLFFHERRNVAGGPIMRVDLSRTTVTTAISDYMIVGAPMLSDNNYVYFTDYNTGIYRIPARAGMVEPPGQIYIDNIEITQSIQTPGNLIPLVANKVTYARVYVHSDDDRHGPWTGVTARLSVEGVSGSFSSVVESIAISSSGGDRRNLNDSFTFELQGPATAVGERNFIVQLILPPGRAVGDTTKLRSSISVRFEEVSGFSAYGICYSYRNVDIATQRDRGLTSSNWPARPFSDFESQRRFAECILPSPSFTMLRYPGEPTITIDYNMGNGYVEGRNWAQRLIDMLIPAGGGRIVVLQPEPDRSRYDGACDRSGAGNFYINLQDTVGDSGPTLAHELGHSWGLPHTWEAPGGWIDAQQYPDASGSMGDQVGMQRYPTLQTRPGKASDGSVQNFDIMSYFHPQWISPFNYCQVLKKMTNGRVSCSTLAQTLNQGDFTSSITHDRSLTHDPLVWSTKASQMMPPIGINTGKGALPYLYVSDTLKKDGYGDFNHIERVMSTQNIASKSLEGKHHLLMINKKGAILSDFIVAAQVGCERKQGEPVLFSCFLPFINDAVELRLTGPLQSAPLAIRKRSEIPLSIKIIDPKKDELRGIQTIEWKITNAGTNKTTSSLWYSSDGGIQWIPLNVGINDTSVQVNFSFVPPSDKAILRVVVTNGIDSFEGISLKSFRVPKQ